MKVSLSIASLLMTGATVAQEQACSFLGDLALQTSGGSAALRQIANPNDGTVTVEFEYEGQGWLGLGFSPSGNMVPAVAVIGRPGIQSTSSDRNPALYNLAGRSLSGVQQLPEAQQTLTDASISQNDTHTILRFVKQLEEEGVATISLDAPTGFIYAIGGNNDLSSFHSTFRSLSLTVSQCNDASPPPVEFDNRKPPDEDMWKLHGYIMAISWGVLIPLGIGASLLRSLFPAGMFFRIHQVINSLAVIGTIAGFAIAVRNINLEAKDHFYIPHMKLGLAVFILALFQAGWGYARPHLPKAPEDGGPTPPKSTIRKIWEYKHRIFGVAILATAWYTVHTGIEQFAQKFQTEEELTPFWAVTGAITGTIILLTIGVRLRQKLMKNRDEDEQPKVDKKSQSIVDPPVDPELSEVDL